MCACDVFLFLCFFFFSSRRRHTRLQGDWSSDVCSSDLCCRDVPVSEEVANAADIGAVIQKQRGRSEEHTSELQSPCNLVCRLLLEKKKKKPKTYGHQRRTYVASPIEWR